MRYAHFLALWGVAFPLASSAATLVIPYAPGAQSGSFSVRGTKAGVPHPDTIVLADSITVMQYLANGDGPPFGTCTTPQDYGLVIRIRGGTAGFGFASDTVWSDSSAHFVNPGPLDVVPGVGYTAIGNLGTDPRGIRAGIQQRGGLCGPTGYATRSGSNRMLYFRTTRSGQPLYGRLMIRTHVVDTNATPPLTTDGTRITLDRVTVSYAWSSNPRFDSAVAIQAVRPAVIDPARRVMWSGRDGILIRDAANHSVWRDVRGKVRVPAVSAEP